MKKLTLFFSMLLSLSAAWAQVTDPANLVVTTDASDPTWYKIHNFARQTTKFIVTTSDGTFTLSDTDPGCYWYLTSVDGGGYQLHNNRGTVLKANWQVGLPSEAATYYIGASANSGNNGLYISKSTTVSSGLNCLDASNAGAGFSAGWNANDAGTTWYFEQVTDASQVTAPPSTDEINTYLTQIRASLGDGTHVGDVTAEAIDNFVSTYLNSDKQTLADLLTAQAAYADIPWTKPEAGKYYRVVSGYEGFKTNASGNLKEKVLSTRAGKLHWLTIGQGDVAQYWQFTPTADGTRYTMTNVLTGEKLTGYANPNYTVSTEGEAATVRLVRLFGTRKLNLGVNDMTTGIHANGHANGAGLEADAIAYGDLGNANAAASAWTIEEVQQPFKATVTYTLNGATVSTTEMGGPQNEEVTLPAAAAYTTQEPTTLTFSSNEAKTVAITEHLPFVKSASTAEADLRWQAVRIKPNQGRFTWTYTNDNSNLSLPNLQEAIATGFTDEQLWAFTGDAINGFTIYNKAAGTGKALTKQSASSVQMAAVGGDNAAKQVWKLKTNPNLTDQTLYCSLFNGGDGLNMQSNEVKTWTGNDAGSALGFVAPATPVLAAAPSYAGGESTLNTALGVPTWAAKAVGAYHPDVTYSWQGVSAEAKSAAEAADKYDLSAVQALVAAIQTAQAAEQTAHQAAIDANTDKLCTFDPSKHYRLRNAAEESRGYLCGATTHNGEQTGNSDAQIGDGLFGHDTTGGADGHDDPANVLTFEQVEGQEGQYYIRLNGRYMARVKHTNYVVQQTSEQESAGIYTLEDVPNSAKKLVKNVNSQLSELEANNTDKCYLHHASANNNTTHNYSNNKIVGWGSDADPSKWYIVPAEHIDLPLHASGEKAYATTCLPFPVAVADDCPVQLNTVQASTSANEVVLHPLAEAAKEVGLLLSAPAATTTAQLHILGVGQGSTDSDNKLLGTLLQQSIEGTTDYVLGQKDGQAGFYHISINGSTSYLLAANRAYLAASSLPASSVGGYRIAFPGEATGLHAVSTETATPESDQTPVYDLSGRRVSHATRGLYIVGGKKVIR